MAGQSAQLASGRIAFLDDGRVRSSGVSPGSSGGTRPVHRLTSMRQVDAGCEAR